MKVLRKQEIETANIQVGDQIVIPLAELGEFTATAHKVTDEASCLYLTNMLPAGR